MKFKTTAKELRSDMRFVKTVKCGYCDLQTLLRFHNPLFYTCGVYGWNFDVYCVNDIRICTGYRGMVGKQANNVAEYERRAREIWDSEWEFIEYDDIQEKIELLLQEFCEQA